MKAVWRGSWLLVLAGLLAACTGGSSEPAAEPIAVEPTATVTSTQELDTDPTPPPTAAPDPAASVTDNNRIAVAIAQLEAEVEVGAGPEGIIAFDLLDQRINDTGDVFLRICAWTGETVFDQVRESLYRTSVDTDGQVSAQHVTTPVAQGDCINTELIESAFDFIDAYEAFRTDFSRNPATYASDRRVDTLLSAGSGERFGERTDAWLTDGVTVEPSRTGRVRDAVAGEMLIRRFRFEELVILEIVICGAMNPDHGIYRNGVLVDDNRDGSTGQDALNLYQLVADPSRDLRFQHFGDQGLVWSECDIDEYVEAANNWIPRDEEFEVLGS